MPLNQSLDKLIKREAFLQDVAKYNVRKIKAIQKEAVHRGFTVAAFFVDLLYAEEFIHDSLLHSPLSEKAAAKEYIEQYKDVCKKELELIRSIHHCPATETFPEAFFQKAGPCGAIAEIYRVATFLMLEKIFRQYGWSSPEKKDEPLTMEHFSIVVLELENFREKYAVVD